MQSRQIYYRYIERERIGIELHSQDNELVIVIRRENKPDIRENLKLTINEKGAQKK